MAQAVIADRYEIGPSIGAGAIGSVYLGLDRQTGEKIAIKSLRCELLAGMPELLERFRREGEALRKLDHPNIIQILAAVEEAGQYYIVMEYASGGSLAGLLKRQPQLPIAQVVQIALELSDALTRAHHLGILHRDIKPDNILLAGDGTPRLTDFGLARLSGSPSLTAAGSVLGTFPYLSPEAGYNQDLDARADIWSFGVVLFEMLTGRLPFTGDSPMEILWAIKNQPLPDPAWYRKDLPPELVDLLRRMLMKDRPARIASMRRVGADLELIQVSANPTSTASGLQPPAGTRLATPAEAPQAAASPENPPPAPIPIRVLIVDDHAVVRQGLQTFIHLQPDMEVIGEGSNGIEAVELARQLQPDVILLDLVMPEMDGVEAAHKILECSPGSHILILTSFGEDQRVFPAIRAGAQGYLLKDIHPKDLVQAVREAAQGKAQLHPEIIRKLMAAMASGEIQPPGSAPAPQPASPAAFPPPAPAIDLTGRELEVLRLIAQGLSNREIAAEMVISEKTVKTHVSNLLGKLNLDDRTQAAIWALKHGLGAEAG